MRKIWTLPEHRAITVAWHLCQTEHFAPSFETVAFVSRETGSTSFEILSCEEPREM